MTISKIKIVTIPVKDQERALTFYTGKLGFKVITDAPMGNGIRWIELEIPGQETHITLFTPPGQEDRIGTFSNILFCSSDVRKTYEDLKAKGVEFTEEPTDQPWGGVTALFKDPDGNVFCLSSEQEE